jgi:hypothetical protein
MGNRYDDAFAFGGAAAGTSGSVNWAGSARFYEALRSLPLSFVPGGVGYAGILPSTDRNPNLPTYNATAPVYRSFSTSW